MSELIAAFARFALLFQEALHGANRAVIVPFVQQRRIHSGWRAILESFSVQMRQDRCAFRRTQGTCWSSSQSDRCGETGGTSIPVVGSARRKQRTASGARAYIASQFGDSGHQDFSSGSCSEIG